MSEIFISYQHMSGDFVDVLSRRIEEKKYDTRWDQDISAGQEWRREIDAAIRSAIAVIVVMTPEARQSEYVTYEWSMAIGLGKPVIPIMLKPTPLHPRLEIHHYLDFTNITVRPWDELFARLEDIANGEGEFSQQTPDATDPRDYVRHDDLFDLLNELYFSAVIDTRTLNAFLMRRMLTATDIKKIRERAARSQAPSDNGKSHP